MRGYYSSLSISDPDRSRMNGNEKASVTEHLAGIHTPLRNPRAQTRLIHFDPVESGDSILVSLETWDSESAPPYNAISYTWGELSDRHAIIINNTRVYVSENCFHALVQARLRFPSDHVWIDAICINRLNIKEESAQVALMGKIYANASLVLACAGPSDAFIRTAIELYGTAIFQDTPKWGELEQGESGSSTCTLGLSHGTQNAPQTATSFSRGTMRTRICSRVFSASGTSYPQGHTFNKHGLYENFLEASIAL